MYLIFSQDHSTPVGIIVFQFMTIAIGAAGVSLAISNKEKIRLVDLFTPEGVALVLGVIVFVYDPTQNADDQLIYLKVFVALFAILVALTELNLSRQAQKEDVLELRISSALGIVTALTFAFAPLNALNTVGLFSAYLALSAVQRAVWAATPNKQEKKN
jgi:uncharacterized membrane protein HdeD (DUF308 family)